ncbi:unnamed protein product [Echinostoma caproni]|uniref:VPS37 C-terminal domain-containing protein n=1 Tax=Echinostoma caproni TaxID=27848 RepID=A0A183B8F6_9TREM|nr:unnamed protein product [Echinostoma caproni]
MLQFLSLSLSPADAESDTYSEDSHFHSTMGSRSARNSSRQRRLFRSRVRNGQKLSLRHSSSPNLPQGNCIACEDASSSVSPPNSQNIKASTDETTPRISHGPRTLSDPVRFGYPAKVLANIDGYTIPANPDPTLSYAFPRIRRSSASTELNALLELVSSVETFRQRLNEHTNLVCTQLSAVENLLSNPEADQILSNLARAQPNPNDLKTLGTTDPKQLASRLLITVKENRASVKEFYAVRHRQYHVMPVVISENKKDISRHKLWSFAGFYCLVLWFSVKQNFLKFRCTTTHY